MADVNMKHPTLPEVSDLSEQIGEFIHYWGFKRVHGRIWTHLFVAKRPLDAADLVQQLDISKALVSISLRELLEYEVVKEAGKSERGTNLYVVNPDLLSVIFNVLRGREKRLISKIQAAQELLLRADATGKEQTEVSQERVEQLGQLVEQASSSLESLISLNAVDFGEWQKPFTVSETPQESVAAPEPTTLSYRAETKPSQGLEIAVHNSRADEVVLIGRPLFPAS
jgi:DNA-binding transcriptional regulator GbsR (MarR family)